MSQPLSRCLCGHSVRSRWSKRCQACRQTKSRQLSRSCSRKRTRRRWWLTRRRLQRPQRRLAALRPPLLRQHIQVSVGGLAATKLHACEVQHPCHFFVSGEVGACSHCAWSMVVVREQLQHLSSSFDDVAARVPDVQPGSADVRCAGHLHPSSSGVRLAAV